jgi:hypothetical protein
MDLFLGGLVVGAIVMFVLLLGLASLDVDPDEWE